MFLGFADGAASAHAVRRQLADLFYFGRPFCVRARAKAFTHRSLFSVEVTTIRFCISVDVSDDMVEGVVVTVLHFSLHVLGHPQKITEKLLLDRSTGMMLPRCHLHHLAR